MSSFLMNNKDIINEYLTYFTNELGLHNNKFEITSLAEKPQYRITIYRDFLFNHIDLAKSPASQLIIDVLKKELADPILESNAVKEVLSEKTKTIEQLTKENNELKQQIEELKPFKAYFEVEYQLRHGKNE